MNKPVAAPTSACSRATSVAAGAASAEPATKAPQPASGRSIVWQNGSATFFDSICQASLARCATGGVTYEYMVNEALAPVYALSVDDRAVRRGGEGRISYIWRLRRSRPRADIVIRSGYPITLAHNAIDAQLVTILHHLDVNSLPRVPGYLWLLKKRLRQSSATIVVSEYWKKFLNDLGCKNVTKIYNSFHMEEFARSPDEIKRFKCTHGITETTKVVYIGNARSCKGTDSVFSALKDDEYTLVASGRNLGDIGLPIRCFELDRYNYLTMMASCNAVVTMSTMPEGWNRTAHEGMLLRRPVIGSGRGGMRELLEGGGQTVVTDLNDLRAAVSHAISNESEYGNLGYQYARRFDYAYFAQEWIQLVENLLQQPARSML